MNYHNPYEEGLFRTHANYTPLSPLTFLERAAAVFPEYPAVIHGDIRYTWLETYLRCRRLASALQRRGIGEGDTVAVVLPNIPAMFEAHYGIAMTGAVLNAINIRLDATSIAVMLQHGEAKVVLVDREYAVVVKDALAKLDTLPLVIDVDDPVYNGEGESIGELEYEDFLKEGSVEFDWKLPADEWRAISLNYTSGTTGSPKGVVYHHRGAYLNAIANIMVWNMTAHPVYLWTLPMFHCNGWCFPWTIAAMNGTNICLRNVDAVTIYRLIREENVDHLCGAPFVLNLMSNAPEEIRQGINHKLKIMTAASAPPPAILESMEAMGFEITHAYGLTEVYGPAVVCAWHREWEELSADERAQLKARQGVRYPMLEKLMVADPKTLQPVTRDGRSLGEIFFRGNIVMKGYLKDPDATYEAFKGGWLHSGDLAVWHEDGYVEIKDRSKDIIISGGENISSIEVENVLYRHPSVLEAAVVARPDEKWGETPCAFIALKEGKEATAEEIMEYCRAHLAQFKIPRTVIFGPLPKTSTGKIQKFLLRKKAAELGGSVD